MRFQSGNLISLVAVGAMALSTPALGQTEYKFQVTNFTALDVTVTCDSGGSSRDVDVDATSPVFTCPTDAITIVQSETGTTFTCSRPDCYDDAGDTCPADYVLHPRLSGTTTWNNDGVLTNFPYSQINASTGCEIDSA